MSAITIANLQAVVDRLNRETGSPMKPYVRNADGKLVAQIGNYHIDRAYGGVQLQRMFNDAGGVTNPLSTGHVSKRVLYDLLFAYLAGIEHGKESMLPYVKAGAA